MTTVLPSKETTLVNNYQITEECFDPLSTVNVSIAASVIIHANSKLYHEQPEKRSIKYDTKRS